MNFMRTFVWLFLLSFITPGLRASLVIESMNQQGQDAPVLSTLTMDAKGLRVDSPEGLFIYRADKKLLWIIDSSTKSYRQMTEADITQLSSQLSDAMKEVKSQMENLPPAQRILLEGLLKENLPEGVSLPGSEEVKPALPKTTYVNVGKEEKIGPWTAAKFEEKENGIKVGEVWTVPPADLLNISQYVGMLKNLSSFFSKLSLPDNRLDISRMLTASDDGLSGLSGIPIKDLSYDTKGKITSHWEMKKIFETKTDSTFFDIPEGYQLKSIMEPSTP